MRRPENAGAWQRALLALAVMAWGLTGACFAAAVPAGPLIAKHAYFEYAVYYPQVPTDDLEARLRQILRNDGAPRLVRTPPASPQEPLVLMRVERDISKYRPPDPEFIRYFGRGLSQEQAAALQTSRQVAIFDFAQPAANLRGLRAADLLIETFARQTGGLIWDEETREIFTPDAWRERRIRSWDGALPRVAGHITIHAYKDKALVRAITLGMAKFGLPDLVIEEISWSDSRPMGNLINAFAQALVEGAVPMKPGSFVLDLRSLASQKVREEAVGSLRPNATAKADLRLGFAQPKEGDPRNRLIEVGFDNYDGADVHARQTRLLVALFGNEPDNVFRVRHDQELESASAKARQRLPELRAAFTTGMRPGEFIQLKVPFATSSGGKEYMWVEVNAWVGERISGLLKNAPVDVPLLQAGQTVEVREADVFDYYVRRADGSTEGNETGKVIQRNSPAVR